MTLSKNQAKRQPAHAFVPRERAAKLFKKEKPPEHCKSRFSYIQYLPSPILKIILQLLQHLKRHKGDMFMPKDQVHPHYLFTLHVLWEMSQVQTSQ